MSPKKEVIGLFLAFAAACNASPSPAAKPDHREQVQVALSLSEQRALIEQSAKLKPGDAAEQAIALLGRPTSDEELYTKDGRRIGRVLKYYLWRSDTELVNEKTDRLIRIDIADDGRITSIKYANVTP